MLKLLELQCLCGDKLVGELNNVETLCHLIITNTLESATVTVPNPFNFDSNVSVYVSLNKDTENKVSIVNNYPFIECTVDITGNVQSMDPSINLNNAEDVDLLNSYVSTYLENILNAYLYKTSKEFKSDIAGFGKYLLPKYSTWNEWTDFDWLNNYQNAFFKVTVKTNIQGGYLFSDI